MSSERRERLLGALVLGFLGIGFMAVLARVYSIQTTMQAELARRAAIQQRRIIPTSVRRGMIVDREGRIMAVSTRAYSLAVDLTEVPDHNALAKSLASILRRDERQLRDFFAAHAQQRFRWVERFVDEGVAAAAADLQVRGLLILPEYVREYPMGPLAAHVLGFTDIDGRGLEGAEATFEQYLAGQPGRLLMAGDVRRRPLAAERDSNPGRDGYTVALTIDSMIQSFVEEELRRTVERYRAAGAIGIVMDPHSGEVLALANWPSFEPAQARQVDPEIRRNRVLTDPIEPGSTFKPFTVAAGMELGVITPETLINCHNGRYSGRDWGTIREYNYHAYGTLSVAEIIMRSSNIGSAVIAQRIGKRPFYDMLVRFGFGRRTGLDLPGEGGGIMRPVSEWTDRDYTLTRVAFGQAIAVTPLQLVRGFSVFANGGKLVRPRLIRGVIDDNGQVIRDCTADEAFWPLRVPGDPLDRQVISPENARRMVQDVLTNVVARVGGTAHNAYLDGYDVFGKTGTAQVPLKDGRGYEENKFIASFIAGAPGWNPQIVVLVIVREPDRSLGLGYTGGRVAAPPVREIIRQTLAYLCIPPRMDQVAQAQGTARR